MTYGSSPRYGAAVRLVVLHTAEGARTNAALASFFNGNPNASSHVSIDAGGILDMVPRTLAAWTIGTGNGVTVNGEMCAFARWTRAQWLSESPVDGCASPRQIIRNAAAWARRECAALGIPARVLTIAQVAAGQSGICDHNAYNRAYNAGDHTDVGPGFPWDVFTQDLNGEDEVTPQDIEAVANAVVAKLKAEEVWLEWPDGKGGVTGDHVQLWPLLAHLYETTFHGAGFNQAWGKGVLPRLQDAQTALDRIVKKTGA